MGSVGNKSREQRLTNSGEYRYHSTTAQALISIYKSGLKPNRGEFGRGVYFSDTEQKAADWSYETTGGGKMLRVKTAYLRDNTNYDDWDDTQGFTSNRIPRKEIEIFDRGEWLSLENYAKRYSRSFGLRR